MNPLVTVITSTTGNPLLKNCLKSVQDQTYPIQHLVIVDGADRQDKFNEIMKDSDALPDVIQLPYATGKDRYNGHRNLAAGIYLAKGDYVCFLDDDNTMAPDHVEECLKTIMAKGVHWSYSLRNIVDKDHKFICQDNCESLGLWASVCGPQDYFVDMNCYFLPKPLALAITPVMHRKFREPGQMEVDRAMVWALRQMNTKYATTGKYTINYAVGNSQHSVQGGFFLQGNEIMNKHYNGVFPWNQ